MTREEAIKLLKEYAPRVKPFYEPQRTEYLQAIDMAIEALSAETHEISTETHGVCSDLIRRDVDGTLVIRVPNAKDVGRVLVLDANSHIGGGLYYPEQDDDRPKGDLISRQWLLEVYGDYIGDNGEPKYHVPLEVVRQNIKDAPSAEAVHIHNDGTLEVKVPNAQKVGRVLVMDTDSHIGGGLFYPDEAVHKPDYSYEADMVKRLRQAEAVQGGEDNEFRQILNSWETNKVDAISKRFISDAILQKISYLNAQGEKAIPIARELIRFKRFVDGLTPFRTEAVQGWIPCSERLPRESGWYLITVQGCEKVADMEWYYSEWDAWNGVSSEQQVIAWMPLPKPYKEDGEEK